MDNGFASPDGAPLARPVRLTRARLHEIDHDQTDNQRQRGGDFEYVMAFRAIRPMVFSSPADAIPETSVPNNNGPTMDFMSRRKMLLIGASCLANGGKNAPISIPATSEIRIHEVREIRFRDA